MASIMRRRGLGGRVQQGHLSAHLAQIVQRPAERIMSTHMLKPGLGQGIIQLKQRLFLKHNPRFQFIHALFE